MPIPAKSNNLIDLKFKNYAFLLLTPTDYYPISKVTKRINDLF